MQPDQLSAEPFRRSQQIAAAIDDHRKRRAAGEAVSDEALIAAHAELMPELGEELRKLRFVAAARQQADQFGNAATVTFAQQDSLAAPARLEVRCPSCHAPVELDVDTELASVTCSSCGGQFSLINENDASQAAPPLAMMGRFELISRVGMGAFGAVWKARDKQLDRTVAIKIPLQGGMTAEDQEKFFREARAAAQLRHPNIVTVYEVGRDGDSIYIVSDFVRGVTLRDWLTGQKLTSREAAELCARIADALHHAHEKGVVHRDLKPANIMIDPDGQPHLMDFGLARREAGEVTVTLDGHVLGTPAYMSPEQAEGESHKADRRSDVYSLGVILFELLTGELPFRGNTRMLLHQVIHDEAPSPRKLNGNVAKDLETITLKCLAKESARRYPTAKELAEEFRRYLNGEPIHARPVSRPERAFRWVRRNRTLSAISAVAILALVGGSVASTLFAIESRRQAASALAAAAQEKKAKDTAVARESETAAVLHFVENKVFAAARPEGQEGGLGHDVTLRQAIESALPLVEGGFKDQPLIEARLRNALGISFSYLGEAQMAAQQFEIARDLCTAQVGPDHPYTLLSINNLAVAYGEAGRLDEALPLYERTLAARRKMLGADHPDTLASMYNLARACREAGELDEAIPLYEQTFAARRRTLGADHPDTLSSMSGLAVAYRAAGRLDEALPLYEQTLAAQRKKLGRDHPDTLSSMSGLAIAYHAAGRRDEALPLFEQTLAARRKKLGADHPDTLTSMNDLANAYFDASQLDKSIQLYEQSRAARRKKLGADHPDTLASMSGLANAYRAAGRLDEAIPLYEQTLAATQKKLGQDHPRTLGSMNGLASAYYAAGRWDEALQFFEQTLAAMRKKLGTGHPDTLTLMNNLANAYSDAGRLDEALPLYERTLAARREKLGADHPDTLASINNLALAYRDAGRLDEALPLFDQVLAEGRKRLGPEHPNTLGSILNLAGVYYQAGRLKEAIAMCERVLPSMRKILGVGHPDTLNAMRNLANAYTDVGRVDDAIPLYEEMLPAMEEKLDPVHLDSPLHLDRLEMMFKLAQAYAASGQRNKAILVSEQALAAARDSFGADDQVTLAAMVDLASGYYAAGRVDQAIALFEQSLSAMRKKLGSHHPATINTMNALGWIFATVPVDRLRAGKRALELSTEACTLTAYKDPVMLQTLAAAYAETGDFESAVKWSEKSLELLDDSGDPEVREEFSRRLANYRAKKPTRLATPNQALRTNEPVETKPDDSPQTEPATDETNSGGEK